MHETHCHSLYSGDVDKSRGSSIDGLCERAVGLGLESIAITDHLEIQQLMGTIFPPLDNEGIRNDITAAKRKYNGRLEVVYGVELAQMCHDPAKTDRILSEYKYDYIIGSAHSVRGFPDFSDIEYSAVSDATLIHAWELYLVEMQEMADRGGFDTLAHITYPYRYYKRHGREKLIHVFENGRRDFEKILKTIISKNIALELNTSGLRQGEDTTFPHIDLLRFYRELGGKLVTVGSDAHYACDLAADIDKGYEMLKACGFDSTVTFRERKPIVHKI